MRAVKGNRSYTITNADKAFYKKQGFDIVGDDGQVLEHGEGKTVPYEKYAKVLEELETLRAKQQKGLRDMKKDELKTLASELGIEVSSKASVEEIVSLIEAKQAENKGE